MKLTTQTVQVAGKSFQLSGMEEPGHYHRLAEMTDRRIRETAAQNPGLNAEACAVAAALSLADDVRGGTALRHVEVDTGPREDLTLQCDVDVVVVGEQHLHEASRAGSTGSD